MDLLTAKNNNLPFNFIFYSHQYHFCVLVPSGDGNHNALSSRLSHPPLLFFG